jgi:nucleoside-diphosphate-sugar epimerase
MRRVLVTGGAGYVGQVLVPKLVDADCYVVVYDKMLFGEGGPYSKENVWSVSGDIRDMSAFSEALVGVDTVIHLACISNDPSFELDPSLSKEINFDCFDPLVSACKAFHICIHIFGLRRQ